MTVPELLAESKAAHYRALSLRKAGRKAEAKDEARSAQTHRASAHLLDPNHEEIAWRQPMAQHRTHHDMHSDLMEFYKAQVSE